MEAVSQITMGSDWLGGVDIGASSFPHLALSACLGLGSIRNRLALLRPDWS